jgi:hypothetical protein
MAQTTLLPKRTNFNESIKKSQKTLLNTQTSLTNLSKLLKERTEDREKISSQILTERKKREYATIRQEQEDELEAKQIASSPNITSKPSIVDGTGSFIDRIVNTLGYLAAGWVIKNLPTWEGMAKEFIARLQEAGRIIGSFVTGAIRVFQSSYSLITGAIENLKNFDLFDDSNRIRNSFDELVDSINDMGSELEAGVKLITTPLTQTTEDGTQIGSYSGQEIPPFGSTPEDMGAYGDTSSGSTSSSVGPNPTNLKDGAKLLTQKGFPPKAAAYLAGNIQTESVWQAKRKPWILNDGAGINKGLISWNRSRIVAAEKFLGKPLETASASEQIDWIKHEMSLPYYNSGSDGVLKVFMNPNSTDEELKKASYRYIVWGELGDRWKASKIAYEYLQKEGSKPQQSQPSSPSPSRAVSAGTMKLIPQTGAGGFIQGGSGSKGEAQYATHFHIDSKNANPTQEELANIREVSFQAVKVMLARGSTVWFGNLNQYASKNDGTLRNQIAAEQRAHDARSSAGVDIQEINPNVKRTFPSQPGSATKFPFAVGEVYSRGGYGREAEIIGSRGITVSHGAAGSSASKISPGQVTQQPQQQSPSPAQVSPQPQAQTPPPAQISQTPSQQSKQTLFQSLTPVNKPAEIFAFIPEQSSPAPQMSQGPMMPSVTKSSVSMGTLLNNFMKQKLLLDLSYV